MFRVAIIGGENTGNFDAFKERCIYFLRNKAKEGCGIMINTTGDEFVDKFAKMYNIDVRTFYTNWKKNGKNALIERNNEMLDSTDALIYFYGNKKDNTVIYEMALKRNIPTRNVTI